MSWDSVRQLVATKYTAPSECDAIFAWANSYVENLKSVDGAVAFCEPGLYEEMQQNEVTKKLQEALPDSVVMMRRLEGSEINELSGDGGLLDSLLDCVSEYDAPSELVVHLLNVDSECIRAVRDDLGSYEPMDKSVKVPIHFRWYTWRPDAGEFEESDY